MSLIFGSNWQELLSKIYTLIVYNPVPFNYSDDNIAFIMCIWNASLQNTVVIPFMECCL